MGSHLRQRCLHSSLTALIVEEPMIATYCESVLRQIGAADLAWAVTLAEAEAELVRQPTIIILDWHVGKPYTGAFLSRSCAADHAVLVYTGAPIEEVDFPEGGVCGYLSKPATDTSLIDSVNSLIGRRNNESEVRKGSTARRSFHVGIAA